MVTVVTEVRRSLLTVRVASITNVLEIMPVVTIVTGMRLLTVASMRQCIFPAASRRSSAAGTGSILF
jgi:hypothetical protein